MNHLRLMLRRSRQRLSKPAENNITFDEDEMTFGDADFAGFDEETPTVQNEDVAVADTASSDEETRLQGLVAYHTSRANKLEAENTTLKVELANVKFDLEHTRLELRQMTSKRDVLQTDLDESLKSKTVLAKDLGIENSEMISTIDKLETERDVLLEQIVKLRGWIVENKGEEDAICEEVVETVNNKGGASPTSENSLSWVDSILKSAPSPLTKKTFARPRKAKKADEDDASDKLYSDDYINEAEKDDDDEEDDAFFGNSYHGNKNPTAAKGGNSSDTSSTFSSDSEESSADKKQKRRVFGVSVRPRSSKDPPKFPKSPKCVSTPIYNI